MRPTFDIRSFERLFKEHYQFLLLQAFQSVGDEEVAKDVVQLFFIDLWEKRNQGDIQNFKAYASRAVRNLALSHLRGEASESSRRGQFSLIHEEREVDELTREEELKKEQSREQWVADLIEQLPEKRRAIFLDFVVGGLSYEQIAQKHGVSINTVKTQMRRSYQFLRGKTRDNHLNSLFLSWMLIRLLVEIS